MLCLWYKGLGVWRISQLGYCRVLPLLCKQISSRGQQTSGLLHITP